MAQKKATLRSYCAIPVSINTDKGKQEELSALTMSSNNVLKKHKHKSETQAKGQMYQSRFPQG